MHFKKSVSVNMVVYFFPHEGKKKHRISEAFCLVHIATNTYEVEKNVDNKKVDIFFSKLNLVKYRKK